MADPPEGVNDALFGIDDFDFSNFVHGLSEDFKDEDINTAPEFCESQLITNPEPVVSNPSDMTFDDCAELSEVCYNLEPSVESFMEPFWDNTMYNEVLGIPETDSMPQIIDQTPVSYNHAVQTNIHSSILPSRNLREPNARSFQLPTISYYTVADIPPVDPAKHVVYHHEVANVASVKPFDMPISSAPVGTAPQTLSQWYVDYTALAPNNSGPSPRPLPKSSLESASESPETSPELEPSKPPGPIKCAKYYGEKPMISMEQPWGRINGSTKGLTSRTGKINHYNADEVYEKIPHPLKGGWSSRGGKIFEYNRWGELHQSSFGFNMLREFILQHPKTKDCKLTLYIQRSPADSMRRYPTKHGSQCRITECPVREYGFHGNITHGHYRVALDELSYKYGAKERNDPMIVSGYVHLYCLERFMDLPALCRLPHVRVVADGRNLSKEPNGKFQAALSGSDYKVACSFIEACERSTLRQHPDFKNYPEHEEFRGADNSRQVRPKHHNMTLNYMMQQARNGQRCVRVRNNSSPSTIAVHLGDLDIYCKAKKGIIQSVADVPAQTSIDSIGPDIPTTLRTTPAQAAKLAAPTTAARANNTFVDYLDSEIEEDEDDGDHEHHSSSSPGPPLRKRSRNSGFGFDSRKKRKL
jgi:hypothetical protein